MPTEARQLLPYAPSAPGKAQRPVQFQTTQAHAMRAKPLRLRRPAALVPWRWSLGLPRKCSTAPQTGPALVCLQPDAGASSASPRSRAETQSGWREQRAQVLPLERLRCLLPRWPERMHLAPTNPLRGSQVCWALAKHASLPTPMNASADLHPSGFHTVDCPASRSPDAAGIDPDPGLPSARAIRSLPPTPVRVPDTTPHDGEARAPTIARRQTLPQGWPTPTQQPPAPLTLPWRQPRPHARHCVPPRPTSRCSWELLHSVLLRVPPPVRPGLVCRTPRSGGSKGLAVLAAIDVFDFCARRCAGLLPASTRVRGLLGPGMCSKVQSSLLMRLLRRVCRLRCLCARI